MFLGIDIGGTNVRANAYESLTNTVRLGGGGFQASGDYNEDFMSLLRVCGLLNRSHADDYGAIEGIGIGIAGVLNKERTMLARAGNTAHWVGQPIVRELGDRFDCGVVLGNDAEAAAMAEAVYANPDGEDFWFVIWGTGIGGTLVRYIDGKAHAFAGEMGHMPIGHDGFSRCACGSFNCLEAFCGGASIQRRWDKPAAKLEDEEWAVVLGNMATGLRLVATSQPVSHVYLSGGIAAKQADVIVPKLEKRLLANQGLVAMPDIHLSAFGESAGTIGALALLKSKLE